MIKVGIIGYGYWGPNLVRNFNALDNCKVICVADARAERLSLVAKNYPTIECVTDANDLLNHSQVDAVIIATPVFTHFDLAKKALQNGKHVLLEKPMASTVAEASELIEIAAKKNLLLMVDHTFLYTGAVQKMKSLIDSDAIGTLRYIDSTRINLGLLQPDINVLWDLAPHDLAILLYLNNLKPYSINATGISHTKNGIENIAYLTVNYQENFIAHFNCSWTSPVKLRTFLVGGSDKMLVYNDLEPAEKLRIYDSGFEVKNHDDRLKLMVEYRAGDIHIPQVSLHEALKEMANDFITSILEQKVPRSTSSLGLEVVRILEISQQSLKQGGKEILL
ncbi:MAG: Gfo/Idh/MocA family oxidoreductase [Ferruginibacter sp.]